MSTQATQNNPADEISQVSATPEKPKEEKTLYLVDGSGYIFRAYYGTPGLTTNQGVPTNAVSGFTRLLLKLMREQKPTHIAIAFDRPEPTFRHQIYAEYKANRSLPPEDLVPQFDLIHRVVDALGIQRLVLPGFEADDLIATAVHRAVREQYRVVIVSGDKDLTQLVSERVRILDEMRTSRTAATSPWLDIPDVIEKMGVPPEKVVDMLALMGDSSDNVPGVAGIGPKTAAELIRQYGDVEGVLKAAPTLKGKQKEKLMEQAEMARLSLRLVTTVHDAPIDADPERFHYRGPDIESIQKLFVELEFRRLLDDAFLRPYVRAAQANTSNTNAAPNASNNTAPEKAETSKRGRPKKADNPEVTSVSVGVFVDSPTNAPVNAPAPANTAPADVSIISTASTTTELTTEPTTEPKSAAKAEPKTAVPTTPPPTTPSTTPTTAETPAAKPVAKKRKSNTQQADLFAAPAVTTTTPTPNADTSVAASVAVSTAATSTVVTPVVTAAIDWDAKRRLLQSRPSQLDRSVYQTIQTVDGLVALAKTLRETPSSTLLAVDTETDNIEAMRANLVGISLAWDHPKINAVYIPVRHVDDKGQAIQQVTVEDVKTILWPALVQEGLPEKRKIVGQNAKYDMQVFLRAGLPSLPMTGDTMLASYLLDSGDMDDEGVGVSHSLDALAQRHLNKHTMISFEELCGKGKTQIGFAQVPIDLATQYAAEDADATLRITRILDRRLQSEKLVDLYQNIEVPLVEVLSDMERAGVKIDADKLAVMSRTFDSELQKLQQRAEELAGHPFNLQSPKQVAAVLFDELGLPVKKRNASGPSTDAAVLESLAEQHELPNILLEYRTITKLKGTYVDVLPLLVWPTTGRVHTHFQQAVTATGRLSSSDPNLQNIPIRGELGKSIRRAFVAETGFRLISLDYSQIELRLLAHASKDPVLVDTFQKNEDVHRRTASEIFSVKPEDVTTDQRAAAKTINFGLLYGMGAQKLARTLGIKQTEAKNYLDIYFQRYAGIRAWTQGVVDEALKTKEVRTLWGRRRPLVDIDSLNPGLRTRAERLAVNTPIQGTAADLMKKAMIDAHRLLRDKYPKARMLLQVHDEILIEAPNEQTQEILVAVKAIMENAAKLSVPLIVEGGIADNWAEAH